MGVVTRHTGSGLVLAEYASDEAAVMRALKQIDGRFSLWPPDAVSPYYRVVCHVSDWQDARVICTWMDENGRPLPLSSGILAEVDRLRLDARNKPVDADTANEQRRERLDNEKRARGEAIMDDHRPKVERGRTSVSFGPLTRLSEYTRPLPRKAA